MRRFSLSLLLSALFCTLPATSQAQGQSDASKGNAVSELDELDVARSALRNDPAVESSLAASQAARAAALSADYERLPQLGISARYTRLSNIPEQYRSFGGMVFPQLLDSFSTRLSLTIPLTETFLSLAASAKAAGHTAKAAELERVTTRAQVVHDARIALYEFWGRTYAAKNAREFVRAAESNAADQRTREANGTVPHNDVLSFETALDAAQVNFETAQGALEIAESTLRFYLSEGPDVALVLPEFDFARAQLAMDSVPSDAAEPVSIQIIQSQTKAAEAQADALSFSRLPRLVLFGNLDVAAPNPRVFAAQELIVVPSWEAGVQLEWQLSQLTSTGARVSQARAEQTVLAARLQTAKRRLIVDRKSAESQLRAANSRTERALARVKRAEELAKARRGELEAGTAFPLAVVDAEADLARARGEFIEAIVARAGAIARLDFLAGRFEPMTLTRGIR